MPDYDAYLDNQWEAYNTDPPDEDGNTLDDVPIHWREVCATSNGTSWDADRYHLLDWVDERAKVLLGEDAEHLDTRAMVDRWLRVTFLQMMCGQWWFTDEDLAKIWLPEDKSLAKNPGGGR